MELKTLHHYFSRIFREVVSTPDEYSRKLVAELEYASFLIQQFACDIFSILVSVPVLNRFCRALHRILQGRLGLIFSFS